MWVDRFKTKIKSSYPTHIKKYIIFLYLDKIIYNSNYNSVYNYKNIIFLHEMNLFKKNSVRVNNLRMYLII